MDKQDLIDELESWRELADHVRTGVPVWPGRYTDARTRDVAEFIRLHQAAPAAWQLQLADALACFWNPAVLSDREGNGAGSAMASGFAAVEQRLRELAADQALVVGKDVDEIALAVARRFTPDGEPQRRARLQVAIANAIRVADSDNVTAGHSMISDDRLWELCQRAELPLRLEKGEVWHWQGDGHDAPESLTCPVVMHADTLRELLQRRPLAWQTDAAAVLRGAAATLQNWEGDPNETGYMGDFGDAVAILEVLAKHAPPAVDLQQFRDAVIDQFELSRVEETGSRESRDCVSAAARVRDQLLAVIDGAPPAPALPLRVIRIPARNNLDPITVFVEDLGQGSGRMVIICYAHAWNAYWGAIHTDSVLEFVASCSADYIGNSMTSGTTSTRKKREQDYADRVAAEVIAEAKAILAGEVTHD